MKNETVFVLGASDNEERYSHKAMKLLKEYGHSPVPVHPSLKVICGAQVYSDLKSAEMGIKRKPDTVTIYVNPAIQTKMKDDILQVNAARYIFNPGTENDALEAELRNRGAIVERACTLVMLKTNQF